MPNNSWRSKNAPCEPVDGRYYDGETVTETQLDDPTIPTTLPEVNGSELPETYPPHHPGAGNRQPRRAPSLTFTRRDQWIYVISVALSVLVCLMVFGHPFVGPSARDHFHEWFFDHFWGILGITFGITVLTTVIVNTLNRRFDGT